MCVYVCRYVCVCVCVVCVYIHVPLLTYCTYTPHNNTQVIVKLASVVIPPVSTGARTGSGGGVFPGGHWHLEGMETERIVATGIYYYEMSNIQVCVCVCVWWGV